MSLVLEMDQSKERFLLNGRPAFLLGASYYGALAVEADDWEADFAELLQRKFNWVRVWCTWGAYGNDVAAVDARGNPRPPYMARLLDLCALADRMGLVVDVTLQRGISQEQKDASGDLRGFSGHPWVASPVTTHRDHVQAVKTVTEALRPFRNVYIDVANERDHPRQAPIDLRESIELISAVRHVDPARLVTISDCLSRRTFEDFAATGMDFFSPHLPRDPQAPARTLEETRQIRRTFASLGRPMPVHYQEPFRRDFTPWQPFAEDFLTDLEGAVRGGAAGWCFHNGYNNHEPLQGRPRRSFDLRDGRLFQQIDSVELDVLNRAALVV